MRQLILVVSLSMMSVAAFAALGFSEALEMSPYQGIDREARQTTKELCKSCDFARAILVGESMRRPSVEVKYYMYSGEKANVIRKQVYKWDEEVNMALISAGILDKMAFSVKVTGKDYIREQITIGLVPGGEYFSIRKIVRE